MARLSVNLALVLVGPTASGKSDIAHAIARDHALGVVSADAMMVYRGMDLGTAKPTADERRGIPYAGIDLTTPDRAFSAYEYLQSVDEELGHRPDVAGWLAVGGTGLYVRALTQGLDDDPGEQPALRLEAEAILAAEGVDALKRWCRGRLPGIDDLLPVGDRENPRRWIRAVERGGCRPLERAPVTDCCVIGLQRTREDLESRIRRRVEAMYRGGLLEEVASLRAHYPVWSRTASMAIGYAEAAAVLDGSLRTEEAMERTVIRTRQYAKRQMTWFRHQVDTCWVAAGVDEDVETVAARVVLLWRNHGQVD